MTTKADQDRLDAIHALPCVACQIDGYLTQCGKTEAHHIVSNGYRRLSGGHAATIPLGAFHHRGEPLPGYTKSQMSFIFGPSLTLNKRAFIGKYGTELDLLKRVNAMLT
jgi:hypothetical protein